MLADLKTFILWLILVFLVIGVCDTFFATKPVSNEEENQIIRPSYDHSSFSVSPGKQE